ncbi:MAG: glycerophosphoryl diester phosphodiesterase membrane domain-containing protein [Chloroflexi bacterium]|nr:glycerophosphoryl diester phosphodiesterase membrane domain-containing protein [Chloroflexota bacterium]
MAGPRLAPMSVSQMLETTARLTRRHLRVLVALAALFLTPALLLGAITGIALFEALAPIVPPAPGEPVTLTDAQLATILRTFAIGLAVSLLTSLAGAIMAVAASHVVDGDYRGARVTVRQAAGHAIRRALAVLVATIGDLAAIIAIAAAGVLAAVSLAAFAGDPSAGGPGAFLALIVVVVTVLVALTVAVRWTLAMPVLAVEQVGPIKALARSWRLTGSAIWRSFGLLLLVSLAVGVLGALVTEILGLTLADLPFGAASSAAIVIRIAVGSVVAIVTAPIVPVALTVLYFDMRVRREGLQSGTVTGSESSTEGPPA